MKVASFLVSFILIGSVGAIDLHLIGYKPFVARNVTLMMSAANLPEPKSQPTSTFRGSFQFFRDSSFWDGISSGVFFSGVNSVTNKPVKFTTFSIWKRGDDYTTYRASINGRCLGKASTFNKGFVVSPFQDLMKTDNWFENQAGGREVYTNMFDNRTFVFQKDKAVSAQVEIGGEEIKFTSSTFFWAQPSLSIFEKVKLCTSYTIKTG